MASIIVEPQRIHEARHRKCFLDDGRTPVTEQEAALLVDQRGFVGLGVFPRFDLPNLSASQAGRDWDISSRAWRWKETLPQARLCAYTKWFFNQGTFISWRMYPDFYKLWAMKTVADEAYRAGTLRREELEVFRIIQESGPVDSGQLWRRLKPRFGKRTELLSALSHLQKTFCITVSGGDVSGWSMHSWDLVERHVPEGLLDRLPPEDAAVERLILQAVDNLVVCTARELSSLFRWPPSLVSEVASRLHGRGLVRLDARIAGKRDLCLSSPAGLNLVS